MTVMLGVTDTVLSAAKPVDEARHAGEADSVSLCVHTTFVVT